MIDFWPVFFQLLSAALSIAFVIALMRAALGIASREKTQETLEKAKIEATKQIAIAEANARIARVPEHLHYAPHIRHTAATDPSTPAQSMEQAPGIPGVVDLATLGHTPTTQSILLGLGAGGQPITVSAKELMHTGVIGATGGGKSNTGRLLLAQLLACNVPVVMADPHFAELDAETGEDWRPIAHRLHLAPARKANDIGDMFRWLADEMTRRYEQREAGQRIGKPIVCYVDELPAIVANVPGAMSTLGALLREGRKVGLYLVTSSQDLLTSTLKTGGEIRENLRTAFYLGGAGHSAVPLLDIPRRNLGAYEAQLGQGAALLRSSATSPAQLVRVPLASNAGIAALLPDDLHNQAETLDMATPWQHPGNTPAKGYSASERRILDMFATGASVADIAREISGAKNGRRYTEASEQAQAVIRDALKERQVGE